MISFDTNVIFPGLVASSPGHTKARELMASLADNERVVLCELVLVEVYCLLRNPSVSANPLSAETAGQAIQKLRHHPTWRIIDYDTEIASAVWKHASKPGFAFRKIFDARIALTLQLHGVTEFATRNVKDFADYGFKRVWNPLDA